MVMNNCMWVLTLFLLWLFFSLLSCSLLKCGNNSIQYESRQHWWQLSYPLQVERFLFSRHDQQISNDTKSRYWPWQSYSLQAERLLILPHDQQNTNNKKGSVDDGFLANLRRHRKLLEKTQLFDFTPFKHHVPVQPEPLGEGQEADPLYGEEKRLVPTGPNPLHH